MGKRQGSSALDEKAKRFPPQRQKGPDETRALTQDFRKTRARKIEIAKQVILERLSARSASEI